MTARALLYFGLGIAGGKIHRQPSIVDPRPPGYVESLRRSRPNPVRFTWAVASLAANADFGLRAVIALRSGIVIFLEGGRMALRAPGIPVLVGPGPVETIAGLSKGVFLTAAQPNWRMWFLNRLGVDLASWYLVMFSVVGECILGPGSWDYFQCLVNHPGGMA